MVIFYHHFERYAKVSLENWTYSRTFSFNQDPTSFSSILLECKGIDTVSGKHRRSHCSCFLSVLSLITHFFFLEISLNGIRVGETDNMFRHYKLSTVYDSELERHLLSTSPQIRNQICYQVRIKHHRSSLLECIWLCSPAVNTAPLYWFAASAVRYILYIYLYIATVTSICSVVCINVRTLHLLHWFVVAHRDEQTPYNIPQSNYKDGLRHRNYIRKAQVLCDTVNLERKAGFSLCKRVRGTMWWMLLTVSLLLFAVCGFCALVPFRVGLGTVLSHARNLARHRNHSLFHCHYQVYDGISLWWCVTADR